MSYCALRHILLLCLKKGVTLSTEANLVTRLLQLKFHSLNNIRPKRIGKDNIKMNLWELGGARSGLCTGQRAFVQAVLSLRVIGTISIYHTYIHTHIALHTLHQIFPKCSQ